MRNLFLSASAAALLFAAPAFAQVGVGAPVTLPGASVSGQADAAVGATVRDPVAAATDITSPTSRAAQDAAKEAQDKADEAAAAASNTSATTPGVDSTTSGSATTSGSVRSSGMSGSVGAAGDLSTTTPAR